MLRWPRKRLSVRPGTSASSFGYQTASITVDGLSSSTNNGRQIRDAVVAMDVAPDERLVLVGYSKGTPDILEGLVTYPELARRVAAVVSVAGSVNGSPLADDASPSLLTLLEYLPGSQCDEGDGGALDSLKPSIRRDFAEAHELPETVQYYSLATFARREQISFGLRGTYDDLAQIDPRNDSQMLFYDQIIAGGALLGFVNADHWAVALPISRARPGLGCDRDQPQRVPEGDSAGGDRPARRGTAAGNAAPRGRISVETSRPSLTSARLSRC